MPLSGVAPHPPNRQTANNTVRIDPTKIGLHHIRIVRQIAHRAVQNASRTHTANSPTRTKR